MCVFLSCTSSCLAPESTCPLRSAGERDRTPSPDIPASPVVLGISCRGDYPFDSCFSSCLQCRQAVWAHAFSLASVLVPAGVSHVRCPLPSSLRARHRRRDHSAASSPQSTARPGISSLFRGRRADGAGHLGSAPRCPHGDNRSVDARHEWRRGDAGNPGP